MQTAALTCPPLEKILHNLGMSLADLQQNTSESSNTFRVEFENQFAVELEILTHDLCRVSARLCRLGKSQIVQNSQIEKALALFSEIFGLDQLELSLAVSKNDNCLRIICELNEDGLPANTQIAEALFNAFEEFAYNAFAFKQTFLNHELDPKADKN